MKKRWIAGLMAVVLLLSSGWVLAEDISTEETYLPIYFNGVLLENAQALELVTKPYYFWDRYLPYAAIAEKLGYTTTYDAENDVVTSVNGNDYFQFDVRNNTTYFVKDSQQYYCHTEYLEWNGTLYISYYTLPYLLDNVKIYFNGDAYQLYDMEVLIQSVLSQSDSLYAWLDHIPNLKAYTCEGNATVQFTAGTERFGIQVDGDIDSSLRIQRNGQEILSTMSTLPNGFFNFSAIDSIFDTDGMLRYYLNTPITAGAYQNQDGIFILANDLYDYQFRQLIPSLQNNWSYPSNASTFDGSYKRGWLQVPENVYGVFPDQLRLLQIADKDNWDIDYLLRDCIESIIDQYGDQGMEIVQRYINLLTALTSPPYLSWAQAADGSVTLSYQISRGEFQRLLAENQITKTDDVFDSLLCNVQPDIQLTMRFSDSAFSVAATANADINNFPADYLMDDISCHATADVQLSGTIGPVAIQQPEVKTTAMLEELIANLPE